MGNTVHLDAIQSEGREQRSELLARQRINALHNLIHQKFPATQATLRPDVSAGGNIVSTTTRPFFSVKPNQKRWSNTAQYVAHPTCAHHSHCKPPLLYMPSRIWVTAAQK